MKNICQLLGVDYPIIQAPMLGVTTSAMVAAVSNAGGLGSLPLGGLSPEIASQLIQEVKRLTNRPFAVNLFTHYLTNSINNEEYGKMQDFLEVVSQEYGLDFEKKSSRDYHFYNHVDLIEVLLEEKVPVISFTFGSMEPEIIKVFKEANSKIIGTATCIKEASILENIGVDAIVAQGIEAGGHRGSFLDEDPLPQIGLLSLVPQMVDSVSLPIIAAGGIYDYRTVNAVFALGASGAQLGTYFIASNESAASKIYKQLLLTSNDTSTELTQAFTGKWARGIRNGFMEQMKKADLGIPYYTYQNSLTAALRNYGKANNIGDIISLWAGQSSSTSKCGSTESLFKDLISQIRSQPYPNF